MEDMFNVINVHHVAVYPQTILNISMIHEDLYDTFDAIRLSGGCISQQRNCIVICIAEGGIISKTNYRVNVSNV